MERPDHTVPEGFVPYANSPTYNSQTVPQKLLSEHALAANKWAKLHVEVGKVRYFVFGHKVPIAEITGPNCFVIPPDETHYIELSSDAVFHLEFFKEGS